jgi:hypothetical protein
MTDLLTSKQAWGYAALLVGVAGHIIYWRSLLNGQSRPHAFSWFVWGLLTAIAFVAQYVKQAGPGSWVMGFTALSCLSIAAMAVKYGEKHVTRSDWAAFIAALAAIPLWYVTEDPLSAVILVTVIDMFGYYPTFRKSYYKPQEEAAFTYFLGTLKFVMSLFALKNYSAVTLLYPIAIIIANTLFIAMVAWRRRVLRAA